MCSPHPACWLLQVFLMMMCSLKYGVFIFFGAWQTVALIFTLFLLPETRGVPIERVRRLAACLLFSLWCLMTSAAGDALNHVQCTCALHRCLAGSGRLQVVVPFSWSPLLGWSVL